MCRFMPWNGQSERSVAKGLNRLAAGRAFFDLLTLMEVRGDRERV